MNELVDVIAAWFDGHSTTSMVVWGWPMLVWGRVGKVMLYFAALSIVLDLLDPHKLRMRGGELKVCATDALVRARLRLSQAGVARLHTTVREHFVSVGVYEQTGLAARMWAVRSSPGYVPRALGCSLEEYQAFHQSIIAELSRVHARGDGNPCDREHDALCAGQHRHISMRIDAFLTEHVPDERQRFLKGGQESAARQGSMVGCEGRFRDASRRAPASHSAAASVPLGGVRPGACRRTARHACRMTAGQGISPMPTKPEW
ncbi:hypothetical protein ACIHFD_35735 [Nonomuraea sp. NPDC051941]|uniref:hypothetical protein n=1 Tax=Nonomuraea sp. NPDC051941 TaxID=3364373 RepID=UPI0037C92039